MSIYEQCPILENDDFILRLFDFEDLYDLLKVYSDKLALPFFNSDNCDGDNFYYPTKDSMQQALEFWKMSYEKHYFVRLSIVDKKANAVIGTVELCVRESQDTFNHKAILRVDVRHDYEKEDYLLSIFSLITPKIKSLLDCKGVITKVPVYAVDRLLAVQKLGFKKACDYLYGKTGYTYDGYFEL